MIEIRVNMTKCQHYGQCVLEAPDTFRFNDADRLEYQGRAADDALGLVEAAADVCPMQAIMFTERPE
ncbi:ferredoxin [Kribbella pittospori]|uniref:Ferredoxin n=1 Tax=Kribbella pittospori TaxID=722689 RepID=A0A4R0JVG7_9ACTN|nr:ferredoxin [Kribbella pittospori]TCC51503.1 ferredoxin [Kribbella pittospori]